MEIEMRSDEGAVCPYCGSVNHVESEDYSDMLEHRICVICNKEFVFWAEFSVDFVSLPWVKDEDQKTLK